MRVAYGAVLLVAPDKVTKRWLGPLDDAGRVGLRALGTREIVLHGLAIGSFLRGGPVRPFLAASIAGDVSDIVATVASRDGLPDNSPVATAAVAGGSAVLSAVVAAAVDE